MEPNSKAIDEGFDAFLAGVLAPPARIRIGA
jgi:hypothetical protein